MNNPTFKPKEAVIKAEAKGETEVEEEKEGEVRIHLDMNRKIRMKLTQIAEEEVIF